MNMIKTLSKLGIKGNLLNLIESIYKKKKTKQVISVLGLPLVATVKHLPAVQELQETWFDPWVGKISRRREWQFTPVFLPGEPHGQRTLTGCGPRGRKESHTTEAT